MSHFMTLSPLHLFLILLSAFHGILIYVSNHILHFFFIRLWQFDSSTANICSVYPLKYKRDNQSAKTLLI